MDVGDVPGFPQALAAVQAAGGLLLPTDAARHLTILALFTAGPYVRAEVLADVADDLADVAASLPPGDGPGVLSQISRSLDQASHDIREALNAR